MNVRRRLWLGMVLVSEGPSDDDFLAPVLLRSVRECCPTDADLAGPRAVRAATGPASHDATIAALDRLSGSYNLVIVHHDGSSDPIEEFRARWRRTDHDDPVVAVVPVRETEAWALADGDALRRLLGRAWDDKRLERLGRPLRGRDIEGLPDPKRTLQALFKADGEWDPDDLSTLGELVSLTCLRELPAFQRWEKDLTEALEALPDFTDRKA